MADTPLTPPTPSPAVGRRRFLATAAGATAALLVADRIPGAWAVPRAATDDPFTLGVASGDPTPTGVVLWTRLAPRPLARTAACRHGPCRSTGRSPPVPA